MATHIDLKQLTQARLKDAHVLYAAGRYDGAAEMCGYALEMALKACICRRLRVGEYPEREIKGAFKTHDFSELRLLAGVGEEFALQGSPMLYANWQTATQWEPLWRYRPAGSVSKRRVEDMLRALEDPSDGVLSWLKRRW